MAKKRTALVTGANRGLGFEVCRQLGRQGYRVLLGARSVERGKVAAEKLRAEGLDVQFHPLDVTDEGSIQKVAEFIRTDFGQLDVLVNNAGIFLDSKQQAEPALKRMRETMETNVYGPFRLCEIFAPLMKKNGYGRIVNVSSGMGQLSEMEGGWPSYRVSKTALNAVTRIFSADYAGAGVLVNSACPGWVRTDMGGAEAELTVEQGADTLVWLATLPDNGPTGGFFRKREPIAW